MSVLWRLKMLKKLATWVKELFFYPPELKEMQKQALETNRVYESALQKAKPTLKRLLQGAKLCLSKNQPAKPLLNLILKLKLKLENL